MGAQSSELDSVELTQRLVQIASISGTDGQLAALSLVGDILSSHGFVVELDRRARYLIAAPRGVGHDLMMFSCHVDTVPFGSEGSWSLSPLGGEILDERLVGRGASDMKSGLAAAVVALCRTSSLGVPAGLVVTTDEEVGCRGAAEAVVPLGRLQIAGIVIPESTGNELRFGHRGAAWINLAAHGISSHASTPEKGRNAVMVMAAALLDLDANGPRREHTYLGRTTISTGLLSGGSAVNVVPDRAEASVDVRYVRPGESEDLQNWLLARHEHLEVTGVSDCGPVGSDSASPWIRSLLGEGLEAQPVPYFTDASVFAEAFPDVPSVIWGPGHPSQPHVVDEYVEVSKVRDATNLYEEALRRHLNNL